MNHTRSFSLALLLLANGHLAQAANTIDPQSTGATDVVLDPYDTPVVLSNPLSDPLAFPGDSLVVGNTATGELLIDEGSSVSNERGFIGFNLGVLGKVAVNGAGSTWTNAADLRVGNIGDGSLDILNGGTVESDWGVIAAYDEILLEGGGMGTVTVDGTGSNWTLGDSLIVGEWGNATLDITAGGAVSAINSTVGGELDTSSTVTVDGAGSTWTNSGSLEIGTGNGGTGSVAVSNGAVVSSDIGVVGFFGEATIQGSGSVWSSSTELNVEGALEVQNGGTVEGYGYIGRILGNTGSVTVTGNASQWTNTGMSVGWEGEGSLSIEDGGTVSSSGLSQLGVVAASLGTVTVDGTGSSWSSTSTIEVGYEGEGALNITGGGIVSSNIGRIGVNTSGVGSAVVDGMGSSWANSGELYIGDGGDGTFDIINGGNVSNATSYIAYGATSISTATVDGDTSLWTNTSSLSIGYFGTATLSILDGGEVTTANSGVVGVQGGSDGTVTVQGTDSIWAVAGNLFVGGGGSGTLSIEDGGTVSNAFTGRIGSGGVGFVNVMGVDSSWTSSGGLIVGQNGSGTLSIENGGSAAGSYIELATHAGSTGNTIVDGAGSILSANSSLSIGGSDVASGGTGTLNLTNSGMATVVGTTKLWAGGTLNLDGGTLTTNSFDNTNGGTLNLDSGTLTIDGGTFDQGAVNLVVDGATPSDSPTLNFINGATTANVPIAIIGDNNQGTLNILTGSSMSSQGGTLGNAAGSIGTVTLTGVGANWTNSGELYVGNTGEASLAINNGATVLSGDGYLGEATESYGEVTVLGADSAWNLPSASLTVGNSGIGVLYVLDGGTVANTDGTIGKEAGSAGTVFVDGTGAAWTSSSSLYVGRGGNGSLSISDGGNVSNSAGGYIGVDSGSMGTVTVDGIGSTWTAPTNIFLGVSGDCSLIIQNGGAVSNDGALIGQNGWVTSSVTVEGSGSTWTNNDRLDVGGGGTGTLNILNGGSVSNSNGQVGYFSSSVGMILVDGIGSTWTNSDSLYLGGHSTAAGGMGTLTIQNSGTVTVANTTKLWSSDDILTLNGGTLTTSSYTNTSGGTLNFADGEITIDGGIFNQGATNLTLDGTSPTDNPTLLLINGAATANVASVFLGETNSGTLKVLSGSTLTSGVSSIGRQVGTAGVVTIDGSGSMWINTDDILVGDNGDGTLNIQNGGTVSSADVAHIGSQSGSTGIATVTGTDSNWTNGGVLSVGYLGDGTLSILDGGTVSNVVGYVGRLTGGDGGAVTVDGAGSIWNNNGVLFMGSGSDGTLTITDGGSVTNTTGYIAHGGASTSTATVDGAGSTWTNTGELNVGYQGDGTLNISNGGNVNVLGVVGNAFIGNQADSTGVVMIDGVGSTWTMNDDTWVGFSGDGTMTIQNGGTANTALTATLGRFAGGVGTVTVDGVDSTWNIADVFYVAREGTGTLNITDGGSVSNTQGYLGEASGTTGTVTVDGSGSTWTNSTDLYVGENGTGTLSITDGGVVADVSGVVGRQPSSSGTVTVNGGNSTWTNSNTLNVGNSGSGALDIQNGGNVTSLVAVVGRNNSGVGAITVDGVGSTWTNSGSIYLGGSTTAAAGTGTLAITYGGLVNVADTTKIWSSGDVLTLNGGTLKTGTLDTGAGAFNWLDGTLSVGTYLGNLTQNTGTLAAGNSPGTTIITGNYTLNSGGSLEVELAGSGGIAGTDFDFYDITGTATLGGLLDIQNIDGYFGSIGQTFDVLTASTVDFTGISLSRPEFSLSTVAGGNGSYLRLTQDTELAYNWINPSGGNFQTGSNWDAGVVPDTSRPVRFNTPGETYMVDYSADATNLWAIYENGNTTLDLGGHTYTVTNPGSTTPSLVVGDMTGDNATLSVGNGSLAAQDIRIGGNGSTGLLNVNPGANVTSVSTLINSGGTLALNGGTLYTGSFTHADGAFNFNDGELIVDGGPFSPGTSSLTLDGSTPSDNPTLTLTHGVVTGFSQVLVGINNEGTLNILNGSSVTNGYVYLGTNPGSTATATVDGAGSSWSNSSSLVVGNLGSGNLFIQNGGNVSSSDGYVGHDTGSTGAVFVDGAGSTWTNSGLWVGNYGDGAVIIQNGGSVNSYYGRIADAGGTSGTVTVAGAGSNWTINNDIRVGQGGSGMLTIQNGGNVSSITTSYIGVANGSSGVVMVDGTGSTWTNHSELYVGYNGNGTLAISNGGMVSNSRSYIGYNNEATGIATVDGAGSSWINNGELYIGFPGNGLLSISNGGIVSNRTAYVNYYNGYANVATVGVDNSTWDINGDLYLGGRESQAGGIATLNLQAGGNVNVSNVAKVWNTAQVNLAGGTINAATLELVSGSSFAGFGTVNAEISSATNITALGGVLKLGKASSTTAYSQSGMTTITNSGTLELLEADRVDLGPQTTLNGGALVVRSGATLGAGDLLSGYGIVVGDVTGPGNNQIASIPLGTVDFRGTLDVGSDTATIYSQGRPSINGTLKFEGGSLVTPTNSILIGNNGVIEGYGELSGITFLGDLGSTIRSEEMFQTLAIGNAAAPNGFYSNGILHLEDSTTLALEDLNDAVLDSGAWVFLNSGIGGGPFPTNTTLAAANGLTLNYGGNITGVGNVDTPNDPAKPFINNGHVVGLQPSEPIYLTGYVKGIGTLDNVVITGTDAPGFSPATVNRGSVEYAGTLEIELGGTSPGQFDQLNHILGAGIANLGGMLDVSLLNGFMPALYDTFEIITASGSVNGVFSTLESELPTLGENLGWQINYGTNNVELAVILPGDFDFDGDVDGRDFLVWQRNPSVGSLNAWQTNYGYTVPITATNSAVPEPSPLLLFVLTGSTFCLRRRAGYFTNYNAIDV